MTQTLVHEFIILFLLIVLLEYIPTIKSFNLRQYQVIADSVFVFTTNP